MIELEAWLSYKELNEGKTHSTVANYRLALKRHGAWLAAAGLSVQTATAELVQKYAGEYLHSVGQSPSSRRVSVSALRGYYRWLKKRQLVADDPAALLPFPRMGRKLPMAITPDDASKLLAQVDLQRFKGVRDCAILSVLLGCGPRVSGIRGLNEEDLIFTRDKNGIEELTILFREKGAHERYVPAPDEARLMLRAYLGHVEMETRDRRLPSGHQVLFVNLNNSTLPAHERRGEALRMSQWAVHKMIQTYGKPAGVDPRVQHPHAFRHLYGKEMAEGSVDLQIRMQLMGHTTVESSEIYSHIAYRRIREQAMKNNPMRLVKHPAAGLADRIKQAMQTT